MSNQMTAEKDPGSEKVLSRRTTRKDEQAATEHPCALWRLAQFRVVKSALDEAEWARTVQTALTNITIQREKSRALPECGSDRGLLRVRALKDGISFRVQMTEVVMLLQPAHGVEPCLKQ